MNYYQFHIGDFNSATRHLTIVERSLYRDLIDMYYDTERAIDGSNFDRLARRLMCRTDDEKTALQYVLDEFFTLDGDLYTHERCEREIQEYQAKREQQSKAGKASAEKRLNKKTASDVKNQTPVEDDLTNVERSLNEPSTNHKPLTNNHKPITSSNKSFVQNRKIEKQAMFDRFWDLYPKKQSKKQSQSMFEKIDFEKHDFEKILQSLVAQTQSWDWKKNGGEFVPLASTWLNGEKWNDEIRQKPSNAGNYQPQQSSTRMSEIQDLIATEEAGHEYIGF